MGKIKKEEIQEILRVAVNAPSGENVQPWRFEMKDEKINVFNVSSSDQSPYSWGQRASFFSHGALITNIKITATKFDIKADVRLFPGSSFEHVAEINLKKGLTEGRSPLVESVINRATNRKPYKKQPLTPSQIKSLENISQDFSSYGVHAVLTDNRETIENAAALGAANDKIMLSNKYLHDFFFSHVNWSKEEDAKNKKGFYIKTFELPPPAEYMFRKFKSWKFLEQLRKFRIDIASLVSFINRNNYKQAPALVVVSINELEPDKFVYAGMLNQKLWLALTNLGLYAQPLAGVLYLRLMVEYGESTPVFFSQEQEGLIRERYKSFKEKIGLKNEHIVMVMRVGSTSPPSAHALKFDPQIKWD